MLEAIHASHNGNLYRVQLRDRDDIADLVREHRLETVGSRDNSVVFWFTPSTHCSHMQLNKQATELLLMSTAFTARQVPLLRGNIVITGNDDTVTPPNSPRTDEQAHQQRTNRRQRDPQLAVHPRRTRPPTRLLVPPKPPGWPPSCGPGGSAEHHRRPPAGRYRSGMAAERRANKANPTSRNAAPRPSAAPPKGRSHRTPRPGVLVLRLLPLPTSPDRPVSAAQHPRGGRRHGTNEKPITAVVPAWLKPGKYAPAFGT